MNEKEFEKLITKENLLEKTQTFINSSNEDKIKSNFWMVKKLFS